MAIRLLAVALLLAILVPSSSGFDFDDESASPQAAAKPAVQTRESPSTFVPLLHRIGEEGSFTERSKLWYRESTTGGALRVRIAQGKLAGEELSSFERLLATGGYYTLRLPSNLSDTNSRPVFASVSTCSLVESRFQEHLELTFSTDGTLTALTYTVPTVATHCPDATPPKLVAKELLFNPTVTISYPVEGPRPIGKVHEAAFLPTQAAKAMQEAKRLGADGKGEGGEQEPPKSFFAKYWMYILPVMLALSMGGGDEKAEGDGDKEGGQGAAAGGSGSGSRPAAGAAATSSSGGSKTKKK